MSQVVGLPNNSYKPITNTAWVRARLCKLKKGALNSQPQVIKFTSCLPMVVGLSPGTPASSTTKTGRHDIAEILLKVRFNSQNQSTNLINQYLSIKIKLKENLTSLTMLLFFLTMLQRPIQSTNQDKMLHNKYIMSIRSEATRYKLNYFRVKQLFLIKNTDTTILIKSNKIHYR